MRAGCRTSVNGLLASVYPENAERFEDLGDSMERRQPQGWNRQVMFLPRPRRAPYCACNLHCLGEVAQSNVTDIQCCKDESCLKVLIHLC